jgi:hypothetical protein
MGYNMAQSSPYDFDIYQPRNPKASAYYKCVENHFEELEQAWDDMYKSRYGYWRTYVMTVIYKYLDCGDLHFGFARVRCEDCGHEYLLAFSCYSYCASFASHEAFVDKSLLLEDFLSFFFFNLKQIFPGSSNKYWP